MEEAAQSKSPATGSSMRPLRLAIPIVAAILLVAFAVWMVGPAPRAADAGFPDQPPPLAIPTEAADDSPLAIAAARLATGDLDVARASFTSLVAEDRDDVPGQVGLILSRWRTTGPTSVERDLTQLAKEYPDSAFVMLHLGLVRALLQQTRGSSEALRDTVELGRDAGDDTSLRMARLADDLLHPNAFRGDLPVLVSPSEVPPADRPKLRSLLKSASAGDRRSVADLAVELGASRDDMSQIAVITATFDKGDPDVTTERLQVIVDDRSASPAARDRARMLGALASVWGGGSRTTACTALRAAAGPDSDDATRRLAGPISNELCR
jgi:hypothetical protein